MLEKLNTKQLELLYRLKEEQPYTYKHSIQVANYAVLLGNQIKLSQEELDKLQIAGLFHDIGKLKIPKKIIDKPSCLTKEEFNQIKKHPIYSVELLVETDFNDLGVLNAILCHHERIDGLGYPHQIKDENILKLTKIISIADSYSAIMSDRVYDPKQNINYAFTELLNNTGSQFDEYLVYQFIECLTNSMVMLKQLENER